MSSLWETVMVIVNVIKMIFLYTGELFRQNQSWVKNAQQTLLENTHCEKTFHESEWVFLNDVCIQGVFVVEHIIF